MGPNPNTEAKRKAAAAAAAEAPSSKDLDAMWSNALGFKVNAAEIKPDVPKPAPGLTGKLTMWPNMTAVSMAYSEATGTGGYKNFDKATMDSVLQILGQVGGATSNSKDFQQAFVELGALAKSHAGEHGGKDYFHAQRMLARAFEIEQAHGEGKTTITSFANVGEMNGYMKARVAKYEASAQKNGFHPVNEAPAAVAPVAAADTATPATAAANPEIVERARKAGFEPIDAAVQLKLEKLGLSTGGRNSRLFAQQGDQAQLDGLLGDKTKASIEKVLGTKLTGPVDETILAQLEEKIVKFAAVASPAQTTVAATPAAQQEPAAAPDVKTQLATQLASVASLSDTAKVYGMGLLSDDTVRDMFLTQLTQAGVTLSDAQKSTVTVKDGVISGKGIGDAEDLLGLKRDEKMDEHLEAALKIPAVGAAVAAAFKSGTVSGGAAVAEASVPGGSAGGSRERS